ncbi:MAG TPA: hypothetical protein VEL07_18320 [Planctomycetota bacterium]|nr:hypothetical protein [Planctomycetota bacterium]
MTGSNPTASPTTGATPATTLDDLKAGAELYAGAAADAVTNVGRDLKARAGLYSEAATEQWHKVSASACDLSRNAVELVRRRPVQSLIAVAGIAAIAALFIQRRRRQR